MSPVTTRPAEPDQACADAVDIARAAAVEDAGADQVGEHVGIMVDSDRIVTHLFDCGKPGYVGWRWAVTVTRAARSRTVTVSESVLLPGPDSLLAPDWVPWTERVRPGDLKPGDLMPARSDDERLVPVVAIAGDPGLLDWDEGDAWNLGAGSALPGLPAVPSGQGEEDVAAAQAPAAGLAEPAGAQAAAAQVAGEQEAGEQEAGPAEGEQAASGEAREPGARAGARRRARSKSRSRERAEIGAVGPSRVLSAVGRDEAAARWYSGEAGPRSPLALAAPANCLTCGFMVRLNGPLGRVFGVCANEYAPDDGKVVSADHGCGAHSDGPSAAVTDDSGGAAPTVDELGYDMINAGAPLPESVLETLDHELL